MTTTNDNRLFTIGTTIMAVFLPRHMLVWVLQGLGSFFLFLYGIKRDFDPQSDAILTAAHPDAVHVVWYGWVGLALFLYVITFGTRKAYRKMVWLGANGFPQGTGSVYQELTGRVTRPGGTSGEDDNVLLRLPLQPYQPRPTVDNPTPTNVRKPAQHTVVQQYQPTNVVKNDGIIYVATDVASSRKARSIEEHDGFTATDRRRFSGDN